MKQQLFATGAVALISAAALAVLLSLLGGEQMTNIKYPISNARAAPWGAPTVTAVDPTSAPNDLDTPIVITGTGFAAVQFGSTVIITQPTVKLDETILPDAGRVNSTTLTATVPWGMNPGVYTLTVVNPDSQAGSLPNAFTVTQGIGVWTTGGPYGGGIGQIVINPITPTTLYALTLATEGLFRSKDGGENWKIERGDLSGGSSIAIDPFEPTTVYLSKGKLGADIYRSDDEGETWVTITIPNLNNLAWDSTRVFAHPTLSGTIFATVLDRGVWKSEDRGQTWVTWTNGLTDTQARALAFDPTAPQTMYVGTSNGNVFRSINGGQSWEFIGQPDTRLGQLAVNPFGAQELWACGGEPGLMGFLWKYDFASWTRVLTGTNWNRAVGVIAFDHNISGTVYVGAGNGGLKSTDGGVTWIPFGPWPDRGVGSLAVDPTDPHTVYQNHWGFGIFKTTNDGMTWRETNNGLAGIIPDELTIVPGSPSTAYAVVGGAGVYKTSTAGTAWRQLPLLPTEDSVWSNIVVDPITPTRFYVSSLNHVHITQDDGATWNTVSLPQPPEYASYMIAVLDLIATAKPGHMVMGVGFNDPSTGSNVDVAGGIYTSTNYGGTWSYVRMGQEISPVRTLAHDPLDPMVLYAGTNNLPGLGDGIWKSTDGGATWFRAGLAGKAISGIAVDHHDSQTVYVVAGPSFYVSYDAGQVWTLVSDEFGGLINTGNLLYVPTTPSVLYVYGWDGILRAIDGGQHWTRPAGALGYADTHSMAAATLQDRVIVYVGTSGGMVSSGAAQAQSLASGETLVNAGVYRYTTRLLNQRVYLPIVLKD